MTDTIVAIATPPGRSGVAVIRLSGPQARIIAREITQTEPQDRMALYCRFSDQNQELIDKGIMLGFFKPASYTGEDIIELHSHGSAAVTSTLLDICVNAGARLAKPGEFTERAYLNGKLDLIQAEAVADLIDSSSRQAARGALRSLQGQFSNDIKSLEQKLIDLRVYVEGALDFVEEEIDFISEGEVEKKLSELQQQAQLIHENARSGKKLHDGLTLVLLGAPNSGKSSLLNCLTRQDSAIVTNIPGTTRDLIDQDILINGFLIKLIDTAGLRQSTDIIEKEGMHRARKVAAEADLVMLIEDVSGETQLDEQTKLQLKEFENLIRIRNKIDLIGEEPSTNDVAGTKVISLSAKSGAGIDLLKDEITRLCATYTNEGTYTANQRQLKALASACTKLQDALGQLQTHSAAELLAEDLRQVQATLGEITGEFYPDDLLGEIFSRFCIGK